MCQIPSPLNGLFLAKSDFDKARGSSCPNIRWELPPSTLSWHRSVLATSKWESRVSSDVYQVDICSLLTCCAPRVAVRLSQLFYIVNIMNVISKSIAICYLFQEWPWVRTSLVWKTPDYGCWQLNNSITSNLSENWWNLHGYDETFGIKVP